MDLRKMFKRTKGNERRVTGDGEKVSSFSPLTSLSGTGSLASLQAQRFPLSHFSPSRAFTLAEFMIVLLALSIITAALLPVITTRIKKAATSSSVGGIWQYASNNSDIYFGLNPTQGAAIGANSLTSNLGAESTRLLLNTSSTTQNDIVFAQAGTPTGVLRVNNDSNVGLGNVTFPVGWSGATVVGSGASALQAGSTAFGSNAYAYGVNNGRATAVGYKAKALGSYSTALGSGDTSGANGPYAQGDYSIALGYSSTASTIGSIALGTIANTGAVNNGDDNIAIGYNSHMDISNYNTQGIAIGNSASLSNSNTGAIAIGHIAQGNGTFAVALGYNARSSGGDTIAVGYSSAAGGIGSSNDVAIGTSAIANCAYNGNNTAIGAQSYAYGGYSMAIGTRAYTTGSRSIAIGSGLDIYSNGAQATAANSMAIGYLAATTGSANATAIGSKSSAAGIYSVAIGYNAQTQGQDNISIGYLGFPVSNTAQDTINIGYNSYSENAANSICIGASAFSSNIANSIAFGAGAQVVGTGNYSIALGTSAYARGTDVIAIGYHAQAYADNSIALGTYANPQATGAVAIGSNATALGTSSVVIGNGTTIYNAGIAYGASSTAIGNATNANSQNTIVIGYNSMAAGDNCIVIGNNVNYTAPTLYGGHNYNTFIEGSTYIDGSLYTYGFVQTSMGGYLFSDQRLKNVKGGYTAGLNEIRKLKPYNYIFKADKKKEPQVGVIAQDLRKVFPHAVKKDNKGYLKIRQDDMFYAMLNSIKQLDVMVQGLVKDVKTIFAKIQTIDDKIIALTKVEQVKSKRLKSIESGDMSIEKQQNAIEMRLSKLERLVNK